MVMLVILIDVVSAGISIMNEVLRKSIPAKHYQ